MVTSASLLRRCIQSKRIAISSTPIRQIVGGCGAGDIQLPAVGRRVSTGTHQSIVCTKGNPILRWGKTTATTTTRQMSEQQRLSASSSSPSTEDLPVYQSIRQQLTTKLDPVHHLQIVNESYKHNVPKNSETHFKVLIVSGQFAESSSMISRHRMVHAALAELLSGPIHALSIVAKTPQQWDKEKDYAMEPSPPCLGGDGSLPSR